MIDPDQLALFYVGTLLLNLTPGPDMLFVMANSVSGGFRQGAWSTLGICCGCLVHVAAAAFGLTALLTYLPSLYRVVQALGAVYLLYLGVRMLRSSGAATAHNTVSLDPRRGFRQGLITNLLNPKVALFFLAFLPQFADPTRGSVTAQILGLGLLFDVNGGLILLLVAAGAGRAGQLLREHTRLARWLDRVCGGVMVALGAKVAVGALLGDAKPAR